MYIHIYIYICIYKDVLAAAAALPGGGFSAAFDGRTTLIS